MKSQAELILNLRAGNSFYYAQTFEHARAIQMMAKEMQNYKNSRDEQVYFPTAWDYETNPDAEDCLEQIDKATDGTVMLAKNYHWHLKDEMGQLNKGTVQWIQNRTDSFSADDEPRRAFIMVGSQSYEEAIPAELQREIFKLDFDLPDEEERTEIVNDIIDSVKDDPKFEMPNKETKDKLIESLKGLTAREAKNSLSYSVVADGGKLVPKTVRKLKTKEVEKQAGCKIEDFDKDFTSLKGYDVVKEFTKMTGNSPFAKGIMLLGPPGTGKTHFAQCLGKELGLEVIVAELAQMMGSGLVGQAEQSMGNFIKTVKAYGRCIVFIDEIEKGLAGVGGKSNDGGTTDRSMGQLLKLMSDENRECYIIATCNKIESLPPEWVRAERWDCAPFFIDLPNASERTEIFAHYLTSYKVEDGGINVEKEMEGWSGAEIKSACRIARMMNKSVNEVKKFVVPVAQTMEREIAALRSWAENKTINASTKELAEVFASTDKIKKRQRRVEL